MVKELPLTQGAVARVDDEDYEKLSGYKWHVVNNRWNRYATRHNGRTIYLHREITSAKKGEDVDHIDGNGLNCIRSNLRVCTHAQNMANTKTPCTNTSGYKGVSWDKEKKRWVARIRVKDKYKVVGKFRDKVQAAHAYDEAARKYRGEFAKLNFP